MKNIEVRPGLFLKIYEEHELAPEYKYIVGKYFNMSCSTEQIFTVSICKSPDELMKLLYRYTEVIDWCFNNTEYFGLSNSDKAMTGHFINELDALAFKLRFG